VLLYIVVPLLLAAAGYAHYRLPRHTAGRQKARAARAVLLSVGVALGLTGAAVYAYDYRLAVTAFLTGFGVVHVPAAFILLFKHARGERPS
jgi:hypothetical protein